MRGPLVGAGASRSDESWCFACVPPAPANRQWQGLGACFPARAVAAVVVDLVAAWDYQQKRHMAEPVASGA
jgi:hypothetical protein